MTVLMMYVMSYVSLSILTRLSVLLMFLTRFLVDGCLQFESENLLLRDDSASVDVMLCVLKCLLLTINAEDDVKDQG